MAYGLGLPLLVIVEEGLRSEGLLEARYDWAVLWLPVDAAALDTPQCMGVIEDWKKRVLAKRVEREAAREKSGRADKALGEKTIGEIIGELKPGQLRVLVAVVAGSLTTVTAVAFSLGAKLFG